MKFCRSVAGRHKINKNLNLTKVFAHTVGSSYNCHKQSFSVSIATKINYSRLVLLISKIIYLREVRVYYHRSVIFRKLGLISGN